MNNTDPNCPTFEDDDIFIFPTSFVQQRLWLLEQFKQDSSIYHMPIALKITGNLKVNIFTDALNEIIQRHEILRTSFPVIDGVPVQAIAPSLTLSLPIVDLQNIVTEQQFFQIQELGTREIKQPFDLINGPLLRPTLFKLSSDSYVFLLVAHHIIADGWSLGILAEELSTLYQAFAQGNPSPLPELSLQYADFSDWQNQWFQGERLNEQLNYWKKSLETAPPLVELPTDYPRPAIQSFQGDCYSFSLSPQILSQLKKFSLEQGVTLFITLLTALKIFLYRWTGQNDLVIGTVIAGRNRIEIEPLIGCFVNFLALRTQISGEENGENFLKQVQKVVLDAYAHQDCPFEKVVEAINPPRQLSYNPIYNIGFLLQNLPKKPFFSEELEVENLSLETNTSLLDLRFVVYEASEELQISCEYNTDLFKETTIKRMMGHFETLLTEMVSNPNLKINQLPLLTLQEKQQILAIKTHDFPCTYTLNQLFEQQVTRNPHAIAITFEKQQLTYEQLNQKANQLARYLKSLGVKTESLVGMYVERSLEMIIGILAILKAGGAYVPIDPAYPQERLDYILKDSAAVVILSETGLSEHLHSLKIPVILMDKQTEKLSQYSSENLPSLGKLENLAYVIYTSGSTGQPKGVLISHNNVTRLFKATQEWFNFTDKDVWSLFHSYAFDFSVWEIWGALLYGGRLVIVPYSISRSPEAFYNLIITEKITILNQTPSAFKQLIIAQQTAPQGHNHQLRKIIFGGEALDIQSLKPWWEKNGDEKPQLINMYGITETTVHVTYRPLSDQDLNNNRSVIGRAIPDLEIYILDEEMQPVPIGVRGEICVAGAGLARGYLNRKDLSEKKFIAHPFKEDSQERLYRSGDVGRYLEDGEIEYLGRLDHQVKIRGFRIELGEIEAHIQEHPDIKEVVVLAREDDKNDQRLVAYVVSCLMPERLPYVQSCQVITPQGTFLGHSEDISCAGIKVNLDDPSSLKALNPEDDLKVNLILPGESQECQLNAQVHWIKETTIGLEFQLTPSEQERIGRSWHHLLNTLEVIKVQQRLLATSLRNSLEKKLPNYMIPSGFVLLESIPLTSNGKVDRRALLNLDINLRNIAREYIAPRTETEEKIAQIWQEVLGINQVGVEDNFFELGGHSLLATQVVSRLRDTFKMGLSMLIIFEEPSLAKLANRIETISSTIQQLQTPVQTNNEEMEEIEL